MSEFLNVRMSLIHPRCICFVWTLKMAICSHSLKPTSHLLISPRMVPPALPSTETSSPPKVGQREVFAIRAIASPLLEFTRQNQNGSW